MGGEATGGAFEIGTLTGCGVAVGKFAPGGGANFGGLLPPAGAERLSTGVEGVLIRRVAITGAGVAASLGGSGNLIAGITMVVSTSTDSVGSIGGGAIANELLLLSLAKLFSVDPIVLSLAVEFGGTNGFPSRNTSSVIRACSSSKAYPFLHCSGNNSPIGASLNKSVFKSTQWSKLSAQPI